MGEPELFHRRAENPIVFASESVFVRSLRRWVVNVGVYHLAVDPEVMPLAWMHGEESKVVLGLLDDVPPSGEFASDKYRGRGKLAVIVGGFFGQRLEFFYRQASTAIWSFGRAANRDVGRENTCWSVPRVSQPDCHETAISARQKRDIQRLEANPSSVSEDVRFVHSRIDAHLDEGDENQSDREQGGPRGRTQS